LGTDRGRGIGQISPRSQLISEASIPKNWVGLATLLLALGSQDSANLPSGAWHRVSETLVISPRGDGRESAGTFNPSVVLRDGKIIMLYRAQDKGGGWVMPRLRNRVQGSFLAGLLPGFRARDRVIPALSQGVYFGARQAGFEPSFLPRHFINCLQILPEADA
jgi:hypothetical protein